MNEIEKPQFLKVKSRNIPKDIKILNQWVCWKGVPQPDKDKWTKVPYNPLTGKKAATNDPETWTDFKTAFLTYKRNKDQYDGIGFVLTKEDLFVGWDLDDCRDVQTEKSMLWADKIIKAFIATKIRYLWAFGRKILKLENNPLIEIEKSDLTPRN